MSIFEQLVTEGNEEADEFPKGCAMMDGGQMAHFRASDFRQSREQTYATLQYAASSHSLVEEWKDSGELRPGPN